MKKRMKDPTRINFQYDGKTSKYDLNELKRLLPFHGALSALFRTLLDNVVDRAYESGNPKGYISALIARRISLNGSIEESERVNPQS